MLPQKRTRSSAGYDRYFSALKQRYRKTQRELLLGLLTLIFVIFAGTLWYWIIEGWHFIEALYMTVITLTTVGFTEVQPLSERSRIFTILLISLGIVAVGYIVNRFTAAIMGGYFHEGMQLKQRRKLMQELSQHYILCGFGRTGRQIAEEFSLQKIPFVVVDNDEEVVQQAQQLGL